uniref:Uncharacterized protein n=1 Tax=Lotharella globosa TaxID=91324 RepID=A0A7S3Z2G2_9EUKA
MSGEAKPKKTVNMEVIKRLAKPVVHKENKDIYKDCSFSPKLCQKSLDITAGREKFHDRIDADLKKYKQAMDKRKNPKPKFSFIPAINHDAEAYQKLAGKGDFMARTKNDLETRKKKSKALEDEAIAGYTFKPSITQSPKGTKVEGTFLQRWEKDLADRNNRVATEKNDPECRFQPEGNRNSQKIMATKGVSLIPNSTNLRTNPPNGGP